VITDCLYFLGKCNWKEF